jgi:hypothetical protein
MSVKFQLDLMYGLRDMLDIEKLVSKYFKVKFELNLVCISHLLRKFRKTFFYQFIMT